MYTPKRRCRVPQGHEIILRPRIVAERGIFMFAAPISYNRLTTLEEVMNYSYLTEKVSDHTMVWCQNNGQIAFSDAEGCIRVTPYRPEIHGILQEAGYHEYTIWVPFSNYYDVAPERYKWLQKMAEEACYAYTYAEAKKIADEKGIKSVEVNQKVHVKQISYFIDETSQMVFSEMATKFLFNESKENIGTYILVDTKTLLVCDEFGRTYLVKVKNVINSVVNTLIRAGYKLTQHPEYYVRKIQA